jgi:GGDEF domain-containing protein
MQSHSSQIPSSSSRSSRKRSRSICVDSAAVVRFETGGFGTIVGAYEPQGSVRRIPGSTVSLESDGAAAMVFRTGQAAAGAAPIRVGARLWGAVVAASPDGDRLAALAVAAQPTIGFADASAQLGALATRDRLTNLPDYRAFHDQLRSKARRAARHERVLSLVLINIDNFKQIKRRARPPGGRPRACRDRSQARGHRAKGELVSRLSADHFGWVLPETEGLSGWIAADRGRARPTGPSCVSDRGHRHHHCLRGSL